MVLDELSEIRARIGDLYDQIQIPPLDTTALWLSSQTAGVVSGAQAETGNINNKFFEVGDKQHQYSKSMDSNSWGIKKTYKFDYFPFQPQSVTVDLEHH